jgi:hypothetical protein
MELKLTGEERDMLMTFDDVPAEASTALKQARRVSDHWEFSLSEDDADDLRDRCGERWQEIGWAGDEVTAAGWILDTLIDKLYTG